MITACRFLSALCLFLAGAPSLFSMEQPFACVEELTMPHFNGVMIHAVPATVQVSVTIGNNGRSQSIDVSPKDTLLRLELLDDFGAKALYSKGCAGRTVVFMVRYTYQGEPTDRPLWDIKFRSPNEILVLCRPLKPILN